MIRRSDWTIHRSPDAPRARAVAGPVATLASLGRRIGLDPCEFPRWLTPLIDATPEDVLPEGLVVEVPNSVFLLWVGELGRFGRWFVRRSRDEDTLRRLGFYVVPHDGSELSSAAWLDEVAAASARKELHGLFVTGHGLVGGFGAVHWGMWNVGYHELVGDGVTPGRLRYGLGLVIVNACLSDYGRGDVPLREPMRLLFGYGPLWRSRPMPAGTPLTAGARDLVARSPTARFFGVKGILNPVLTTCHVCNLLRPGDQGTVQ